MPVTETEEKWDALDDERPKISKKMYEVLEELGLLD
jgi:hypothetical protein